MANYFNRLKRLWEDLNSLRPLPFCECEHCMCELSKKLTKIDSWTETIQFLMGLNEVFDVVKSQILMQEPLPNANRAYVMLKM